MYSATAAVLSEPKGLFELKTVELDDLRPDEILVRIEACGVCHTDAKAQSILSYPMVLGHEGTGVVETVGAKTRRVKPGQRVIITYPWCGSCPQCISGQAFRCEHSHSLNFRGARGDRSATIRLGGRPIASAFFQQSSFASHAVTLERDVVVVTDDHAPEMLAAIPCGVLTGAGSVLNSLKVGGGDSLAVFGSGAVGLSAIMAGKLVNATPLIAVDVVPSRMALALELGATHAINAAKGDVVARIKEIAPQGVAFSLDTSTKKENFERAIACLKMGGHFGFVATPEGGEKFLFSPVDIFSRTATVQGIIQGSSLPHLFLPKLIQLQQQGRFPYERLIRTYPFADINQAFADSAAGEVVKPVLMM